MLSKTFRCGVIALALTIAGAAVAQTIAGTAIQAAAQTALHLEQKMRDAGIRLTPDDVNAIKAIELRRATVLQMYRDMNAYQRASEKSGDSASAKQADLQKSHLKLIQKELPSADGSVGGYYMEIRRYLSGPAKKHASWMKDAQAALQNYHPANSAPTPDTRTLSSSGNSSRSGWEVYIIKVSDRRPQAVGKESGYIEFYVNGVKVTGSGQHIPISGSAFNLRAFAVGDVRTKWQNFRAPENTDVVSMGDYRARYDVAYGGFKGLTDWYVDSEKYTWNFTNAPNQRMAKYGFSSSSGNKSLLSDLLSFTFDGAFSAGMSVTGDVNWIADSQRPGGMFHPKDHEAGSGEIVFSVGPRG